MKVTVRDASRLLSVSETELYRWIEDGQIPFHVVNHQPLFNRAELLEWATEKHLPVSIELFADEGKLVVLADALEAGGIHYGVAGADRDAVLAQVVAHLPIDDDDREMVLHILLAREAEASTGVGRGIAIPHVRTPLVFAGRPPAIALCFLQHAVLFGAIDARPVHTVFAMMTPTIHGHLQLLGRLSLALHDREFCDAIEHQASKDTILAQARRLDAAMVRA